MSGGADAALKRTLRRRFKKLYEDFRPQFMHWKLVLLARKFLLAVVAIMLDRNPMFQV